MKTAQVNNKRIHNTHYYVVLNGIDNSITLTLLKTEVASILCISTKTLTRAFALSDIYIKDDFTVWNKVSVNKLRRGFNI